jgi:predicted NACHT family NTPase
VLLRRLGATALLVTLAAGAYVVGQVATRNGLDWADKVFGVASFFLAFTALLVPAFRWVSQWLSRAPLADIGLPQAMEDLAMALRRQLVDEERLRKVNDPRPLPVRWDVVALPAGAPPDGLAGHFEQVLPVFSRLPARRLVVLGPAGAGKSVLVARLARDLLETRHEGEPVPVIVPMATWNVEVPLGEWLAGQLVTDHPGLGARVRLATGGTISLAGGLLAGGGILPLLDGFDELPEPLRERAVAAINAYGSDQPLVVTSRPDEYAPASDRRTRQCRSNSFNRA